MHVIKQNGNISFSRREDQETERFPETSSSFLPEESSDLKNTNELNGDESPSNQMRRSELLRPTCHVILSKLVLGLAHDRDMGAIFRELRLKETMDAIAREQVLLAKIRELERNLQKEAPRSRNDILDEAFSGRWKEYAETEVIDWRTKLERERDDALERAGEMAMELLDSRQAVESKEKEIRTLKELIRSNNGKLTASKRPQRTGDRSKLISRAASFRFFSSSIPEEDSASDDTLHSLGSGDTETETLDELRQTILRLEAEKEAYASALSEANEKLR